MNVAEYLLARLQQAGLQHLFAVPGDYAGPSSTALDTTPGIERVPNINELGSGYAADGYARFKGIGAACVQYGVGDVQRPQLPRRAPSWSGCRSWSSRPARAPRTGCSNGQQADPVPPQHRGPRAPTRRFSAHVTVASEIITDPEIAPAQIDARHHRHAHPPPPDLLEVLQNVWTLPCASPSGTLSPATRASDPSSLAAAGRGRLGPHPGGAACRCSGPGSRSSASACRPRCSSSSTPAASPSPPPASARPCSTRRSRSSSAPMPAPPPRRSPGR